ncbi:unnamed protein product [Psylliodes chrysocephalus]|uniref:Cullin-5 n=1 Tax=Psylliodes chrysocephalus TaxID=3402493 RepID=A0A9P0CQ87_9CUCU|nr:unnamed protein product [Psylliodes chrysocephala]
MLKEKGQLKFEDKWPYMGPIVLKLLKQEPVSPAEWQELFYDVHLVCLWDEKGPAKLKDHLHDDIVQFIKQAQTRGKPASNNSTVQNNSGKKTPGEESIVRKLMLDSWNESIFSDIKHRLQESAMKLVHAERNGEAFDSQLVIGM